MSFTFGFYNSLNHDRKYNAIQMSSIFDGIIRDGIFMSIGACMMVKANSGMTVTVGEGRAWFNHTWSLNDAEMPITLERSELVLHRIDAIVLDIDARDSVRTNSIMVLKGTPSSSPSAPTLVNSTDHHQYPLAEVYVKAGVTKITTADITNKVGTSKCPFVTGILDTINIDNLISKWEAQWDRFYAQQTYEMELAASDWKKQWDEWFAQEMATATSAMQNWLITRQAEFDTWFASLQEILSGDVAANLASRVLTLEEKFGILATEFCVYHNLLDSSSEVLLDSNGNNIESRIIYVTK